MTNDTYSLYEIQLNYVTDKLGKIMTQLKSLEPNRAKRGLVDGLGSIIKSISGNLDQTDALKYNEAILNLQSNQNKIVSEFNNHVSMNKEWITKHTNVLSQLVENQVKINSTMNLILQSDAHKEESLLKYVKFAQLLEVVSDNVEDLMQELIRIENSLAFIRASSTHHSMIDIDTLGLMINRLKLVYGREQIIDLELREYYDLIKPGSYYSDKQIILVFKFPIISSDMLDFYRLAIVPNNHSQALIPSFPFLATNEMTFVYMEAECPKFNKWFLCDQETAHQTRTKSDCIQELITNQVLEDSCQFTTVTLSREAMERLDDQHYVLSFPHQTKVQLICGNKTHTSLHGSYLAMIPVGCRLKSEELTITNEDNEVKGQPLKLTKIPYDAEKQAAAATHVKLNSIDLQGLHSIQDQIMVQTPVQVKSSDFNSALYHTTIPFYGLLLGAGALSIIILLPRYLRTFKLEKEKMNQQTPAVIIANPEEPGKIPATFSLNVLQ